MDGKYSSIKHNKQESILQYRSSEPHSVPLKYLKEITNDFSDERLLGEGGFGKVYKGVQQNGDMIAVKKLTWTMTGIHDKQYENEVQHLMGLRHPNIVELVGYCSETEKELVLHNGKYVSAEKYERLLCFEYMTKGCLRGHISDESSGLDWDTRYKIIMGICYGLDCLHQANTPIIHRDLKPANILLDDNMVPKIADFGLSRLFGELQTLTITKNIYGTLGYMSPEYLNYGTITKKLDIFSLGVIIIEITTGDRHYPDMVETHQEFIELVLHKWRNRIEKVPGYTSQELCCQQIKWCLGVGLLCVKLDRAERPTTHKIIEMLTFGGPEHSNSSQIIKNEDLEDISELGSGTCGTVYHGKWIGCDVAIRRIKKSCFTGRPSEEHEFYREASELMLHHPNIVPLYGVVKDGPDGTLATVNELMVDGSLRHVLQRKEKYLDRLKRLKIAMDAAFGMEYLHAKNIVHFDLKCDNLLVNLRNQSRPICKVGPRGGGALGALPWMAPELLNGISHKVSEKGA